MISNSAINSSIQVLAQLSLSVCLVAALGPIACSRAQEPEVGTRVSKNLEIMTPKDGHAIGGYDAVSYFLDAEPRMGVQEFSYDWRGATWLFATASHRDLFQQNPLQYAPVYGGWCAYGMTEGYAAESDPLNAWSIHDGKLYLNWDAEVADEWRSERTLLVSKAETNWPEVKSTLQDGTAEIYWHDDE
jgi:YHS domain-containing protein